jgi:hypothetical protein
MSRYRFLISANDFPLKTVFSLNEESGLKNCKKYIARFQRQVANVPIKIDISVREKQEYFAWYAGKPFTQVKTLIKKPIPPKESKKEK